MFILTILKAIKSVFWNLKKLFSRCSEVFCEIFLVFNGPVFGVFSNAKADLYPIKSRVLLKLRHLKGPFWPFLGSKDRFSALFEICSEVYRHCYGSQKNHFGYVFSSIGTQKAFQSPK